MADSIIRQAMPSEAGTLTELMRSSSAYSVAPYTSVLHDIEVSEDRIREDATFAAVDHSGEIIGFYVLVLDPPELDMLFVADTAQGRGVGRQLVEHMMVEARRAGLTSVRVVSHPPAEAFYRRLGAKRIGTVAAKPPKVTWERPDLRFTIPAVL